MGAVPNRGSSFCLFHQFFHRRPHFLPGDADIPGRGLDVGVAHEFFNYREIRLGLVQAGEKVVRNMWE